MKISVCIPAYKNADYLKRNLDALTTQTLKDFEVILSDDSPDDSVLEIAEAYQATLDVKYFKNVPAKGTPANWNYAMQQATGSYIKLIHDDDWLSCDEALQEYYDCLERNPTIDFCFSAFFNVQLSTGNMEPVFCSSFNRRLLKKDPYNLFRVNFIGPPSAVFQRNNGNVLYDENLRWLVDFEGYIRFLKGKKPNFVYLHRNLVNIGLGQEQVTQTTKHVKEVVIPESMYVLEKHGPAILKNMWVYDYYWRMFRNLRVQSKAALAAAGWQGEVPATITQLLTFQKKIPQALLKLGPISKLLMFFSFKRKA